MGWLTIPSSYKTLSPKTRGLIGLALMVNASAMLWASDHIEEALGMKSDIEQREKFFKIQRVDRETEG